MEQRDHCFQCGEKLAAHIYAVYRGKSKTENKPDLADHVIGYLCDRCRGTNKVKALKSTNDWKKLEELKKLLQP